MSVAGYEDPVEAPSDWDKAVSAAYLRMIGHTQEEAASGAGCGVRTLRRWERCSWWEETRDEARNRWLNDLVAQSRATLFTAIEKGDADKALKILERMDDSLLPPSQRHEIMGEGGGPVEYRDLSDHELQERANQLKNRLSAPTASENGDGHG